MKMLKKIMFTLGTVALFTACSSDKDSFSGFDYSGKSTVKFNSNIVNYSTRVADNTWELGDAVGLYAVEPGKELSEDFIYDGRQNVEYATMAGNVGKFSAATPTEAIQVKGINKIDVIGYYPYQETITDFNYSINVKNQADFSKIDVLYTNNLRGIGSATENELVFNHKLSKLIVQVELGSNISSLVGLKAKALDNVKVEGIMNLRDGVVSVKQGAANASITPRVSLSNNYGIVEALLIPTQSLNSAKLTLELNGQEFIWEPSNDIELESGKKYTYRIQLSADGNTVVLNPEGTIEDWEEGNTDTGVEVITPGGGSEVTDNVSVESTYVQFVAAGESKDLQISASKDDISWTIASNDTWITLDKTAGTGSGVVKVTLLENMQNTERTGTITLTATGQNPITITAFQTGTTGGEVGQEVVISEETFGVNDGLKFDQKFDVFDTYTGFTSKPGITVSNKGSRTDIRARSTVFTFERLAWLPPYNPTYPFTAEAPAPTIEFSGIETQGFTNIKISFSISGNLKKGDTASTTLLHVYVDDKELTVPNKTYNVDAFTEVEIAVDAPFSKLTFKTDEQNAVGVRLDNIKIVGTK